MHALLRKLRGLLGTGLTWGAVWAAVIAAIGMVIWVVDPGDIARRAELRGSERRKLLDSES